MKIDRMLEIAKEAGFKVFDGKIVAADDGVSGRATNSAKRFADLILEEAARACDSMHDNIKLIGVTEHYPGEYGSDEDMGYGSGVVDCADAIRSLKQS